MTVRGAQPDRDPRHSVVILAAGEASRFGSPKQVHRLSDGRTMLQRVVANAAATMPRGIAVVVGAHLDTVRPTLDGLGVRVVVNPAWRRGMAESISLGVRTACPHGFPQKHAGGVLLLAGDQPEVSGEDLARLLEDGKPRAVAAASYAGTLGIPAFFGRKHHADLTRLGADGDAAGGAKALLRRLGARPVPMPSAARDVDTPDHAAALDAMPG